MKKILNHFFIAGCIFILSCSNNSKISEYSNTFQKIIKNDKGLFRGFLPGDSLRNIQASENGTLLEGDSTYLFYEYKLDSSDTYTLEYQFENKLLSSVRADVYMKDIVQWKIVFENFREFFNTKYGNCSRQQDSFVWKINNGSIHVVLTDESANFEEGILSLEIYYAAILS